MVQEAWCPKSTRVRQTANGPLPNVRRNSSGSRAPGAGRPTEAARRDAFGVAARGKALSMSEPNEGTHQKTGAKPAGGSGARRTAEKATAPAAKAAKTATAKADDAASAAKSGAERSADTASAAVQTAAKGVEAGRKAVVTASGQVAATARTAWTVIANRRLVAAGVGAGLTALSAASYAVGRRAGRHTHGPLTRLTGGRI
jgi:hypothetical protein